MAVTTTTGPSRSATRYFDPAAALARVCGDLEFLQELAGLFHVHQAGRLAEIVAALDAGDAAGVRRAAHALKGGVGLLASGRPLELAQQLEAQGASGNLRLARADWQELSDALQQMQAEIDQFLSSCGR